MKKQGEILVIGDTGCAEDLKRSLHGDHYRFTCCTGDNHAGTPSDQTGRCYDWVVINGGVLGGDEMELIRSLRAMGFFNRLHPSAIGPGCGVEWLPDGTLQLRCCAQAQQRHCMTSKRGTAQGRDVQGFVFEYHAPVKRTG